MVANNPTGQLTFRWVTNCCTQRDGFVANIDCIPTETVSWVSNNTSTEFDIDYSTDNGTTWTQVGDDIYSTGSSHSFRWDLPNTPTATAKVRIQDANNTCKTDESDAVWTITADDRELTSPNGSENWFAGTNHTISWRNATYLDINVKIEYSIDNGVSWQTIIASTPNDGSHTWTVPNSPTSAAKVRISEVGDATASDISDANFTILPHITVTAPDGGETLEGCENQTISWSTGGTSNSFHIEYSTDNGNSWQDVVCLLYTSPSPRDA